MIKDSKGREIVNSDVASHAERTIKRFLKSYSGPKGIAHGRIVIDLIFDVVEANGRMLHFKEAIMSTYVCGESDMREFSFTEIREMNAVIKVWDEKMPADLAKVEEGNTLYPVYTNGLISRGFVLQK